MEKILIIDDSIVQADVLRSIIKEDYEVSTAHTAEEGLQIAKTGQYSLILLDVIMPGTDGFTVLKELQEDAVTRRTPVILITSLTDVEHEVQGLIMGAVDYITKPFNPLVVKARVNTHVKLYRYRAQIEKEAMVDELTNLANRRHYDKQCIQKWNDAIRLKIPFSVCMFDIDRFKVYNDTYGHPAGDKVIAAVAGVLSAYLRRTTDFVARYGGEEFVAIIQGGDAQTSFDHLKTIRQAVEDLHIVHSPPESPWVTISVGGITVLPKNGDVYQTYLKIADTMLYDAKRYGRNRVIWCNDSMEQWREK
jgi:diguanylate cyclase (GGDEF)-like protein